MPYKLIAIDLDDSLLHDDLTISKHNQEAIRKAVEKGVIVTVATGRMFQSALPIIEQLGLNVPVITYQGALIINAVTQETLYHMPVPFSSAIEIINIAKEKGIHCQAYLNDRYYFDESNEWSELYHHVSGIEGVAVGSLLSYLKESPTKILWIDNPDKILACSEPMKKYFGNQLEISISKPQYLEFTHPDANKGKAISYLMDKYHINQHEVMAIGDSYNDIPMISFAGMGVAMGNAPDVVKKAADFITASNNNNGVALAIEKWVL